MNICIKTKVIFLCCFVLFANLAKAEEYNAAIYVDQSTGIAGTAYNFSTIEKASAGALQTCKKKSGKKSCTMIIQWSNGCAAVAWSPKNRLARLGTAETSVREAESKAIERCALMEDDPNCKIVSSICTKWDTDSRTLIFY